MEITSTPGTHGLLQEQMRLGHFSTPDDVVRTALQTLAETRGEDYEELDPQTRAAIEEAEAQYQRGQGRPWAGVRAQILARFMKK